MVNAEYFDGDIGGVSNQTATSDNVRYVSFRRIEAACSQGGTSKWVPHPSQDSATQSMGLIERTIRRVHALRPQST